MRWSVLGVTIPHTGVLWRHVALVAIAGLGGAFFGAWDPLMAIRGAILCVYLALGIPVINGLSRKRLEARKGPDWRVVIGVASAVALMASASLSTWPGLNSEFALDIRDFDIFRPTPAGWRVLVACLLYALVLHGAYAARWRSGGAGCQWALGLVFAIAIVSGIRVALTPLIAEGAWVYSVFQGLPFGVFWLVLLLALDPAASVVRWEYLNGLGDDGEDVPESEVPP